ncbi:MAG: hypothetical protein A2406_00055 [Candidatus Komeilibacteria bacterium RIFOXYC1_FULL_37_11]|uniref:Uncharacterized protein n=1 Tax=Candidatus Komeilibacteria bacterium RIFOXYC1_FULL_37_11 TaxID=1798555 RepID=A0A1G2BWI5_9BACT|nr:MAG: hypothetical protein A2406_00055 [Candidatus Komeilibacteria bacterium RIFOXYC1_FULL_37_11]OGY95130.1 MAG: hypothetical protein A2611_00250 [Candidatus Komeilibacteria bacterium RIFOXYD1_FULL_37_29]OGY96782.1 MAG: hypothetical protein A2543_00755 [Candidatus Komeilibacteria bacterium RIFOXYD2_FULL_37_8]
MLKKFYKLSLALFLFFVPVFFASAQVIGQDSLATAAQKAGFGGETDVYVIITRFINGFLSIFMMVFLYFIIAAGFTWMTSGGNAEKINTAKETIKYSLIGIVVALTAYSLARYVLFAMGATTGIVR